MGGGNAFAYSSFSSSSVPRHPMPQRSLSDHRLVNKPDDLGEKNMVRDLRAHGWYVAIWEKRGWRRRRWDKTIWEERSRGNKSFTCITPDGTRAITSVREAYDGVGPLKHQWAFYLRGIAMMSDVGGGAGGKIAASVAGGGAGGSIASEVREAVPSSRMLRAHR